MQAIYQFKIPMPVRDAFVLSMEPVMRFLDVQVQNGVPTLWALVDPGGDEQDVRFCVLTAGTGQPDDDMAKRDYVGTFMLYGDSLVGHVFVERATLERPGDEVGEEAEEPEEPEEAPCR